MTLKKTFCTVLLALLCLPLPAQEKNAFKDEKLNYQIVYHWGIIWKHAASATLSLSSQGDKYHTALCAQTVSWADKFYRVRDTLTCTILKQDLRPLRYVKKAHEGKELNRDIVDYSYADGTITAKCTAERKNKPTKNATMQATNDAFDMLSVFYYLRAIDYDSFKQRGKLSTTIFSGKRKENLTLTYVAREQVQLRDKSKHDSYHVTFTFTQDGKSKSSKDIHCWISTDSLRIPLMLKGSIKVGEVRVYYKPC